MSRILSAPLLDRKGSWVLGVGLAISLVVGCGSQGDNGGDDTLGTGGKAYPGQGGAAAAAGGNTLIIMPQGGRATGGRPGVGQGGVVYAAGGQIASTSAVNCTTGILNCPCYTSGLC